MHVIICHCFFMFYVLWTNVKNILDIYEIEMLQSNGILCNMMWQVRLILCKMYVQLDSLLLLSPISYMGLKRWLLYNMFILPYNIPSKMISYCEGSDKCIADNILAIVFYLILAGKSSSSSDTMRVVGLYAWFMIAIEINYIHRGINTNYQLKPHDFLSLRKTA